VLQGGAAKRLDARGLQIVPHLRRRG
jgi:hypothetical protein